MPRGPNGERRPADAIGCAVRVAQVATGEIDETPVKKSGRVRSGHAGAKARKDTLTKEQRHRIAQYAAKKRWGAQATGDCAMTNNSQKDDGSSERTKGKFAHYTDNMLQAPKMPFEETSDLRTVVKKHFDEEYIFEIGDKSRAEPGFYLGMDIFHRFDEDLASDEPQFMAGYLQEHFSGCPRPHSRT